MMNLSEEIQQQAIALGFDRIGIAPARPVPRADAYHDWLARGYHGEMSYLARPDRLERRADPALIVPEVESIVVAGLNYFSGPPPANRWDSPAHGRIARYAWGANYHDLMVERLKRLASFVGQKLGKPVHSRAYVDTGPIPERAYAERAGLGFIGKNTSLIDPRRGSWLFLGEILLDIDLPALHPTIPPRCGTCRRCLEACPTGALVEPYVLDARRCIAYLTIELKGPIPRELRPCMSNRIYGCDVCQAVCPWQRFAHRTEETAFHAGSPDRATPALLDLMTLDEEGFRRRYAHSPILRIKRRRLLRNVAVALGNWGAPEAVPALTQAMNDPEDLVRGHAAWALGRIGGQRAEQALREARRKETDLYVQEEIELAIQEAQGARLIIQQKEA